MINLRSDSSFLADFAFHCMSSAVTLDLLFSFVYDPESSHAYGTLPLGITTITLISRCVMSHVSIHSLRNTGKYTTGNANVSHVLCNVWRMHLLFES